MQDGLDLITALAIHPETARRLARKFWNFFVSEISLPDPAFVEAVAAVYLQNRTEIRPVVRYILSSPWFTNPAMRYARYSWPVEFVTRAIKEVGWQNFSLDKVRSPMATMGQLLYEPPNVAGWPLGANWFSTGRCWRGRISPPRWRPARRSSSPRRWPREAGRRRAC